MATPTSPKPSDSAFPHDAYYALIRLFNAAAAVKVNTGLTLWASEHPDAERAVRDWMVSTAQAFGFVMTERMANRRHVLEVFNAQGCAIIMVCLHNWRDLAISSGRAVAKAKPIIDAASEWRPSDSPAEST